MDWFVILMPLIEALIGGCAEGGESRKNIRERLMSPSRREWAALAYAMRAEGYRMADVREARRDLKSHRKYCKDDKSLAGSCDDLLARVDKVG